MQNHKRLIIKTLLTTAAAILVALSPVMAATSPPTARRVIYHITTLPPAQYDKPFEGQLEIQRFSSSEDLLRICKGEGIGVACSARLADGTKCWMFIATDKIIEKRGYTLAIVLRHELGHCNGWKHDKKDKKKDGGIWVRADNPRPMPALPASTYWLPAHPPVVCLTPEWKSEPCKNRNETQVAKP